MGTQNKKNKMLNPLKYETKIKIEDIPLQWMSRFELYYPDLPQFPITYIHNMFETKRIYGFIAATSFDVKKTCCDVELLFISNIKLNEKDKKLVKVEIEERFGSADKVGIKDMIECCNGQKQYISFFKELWKYISRSFGEYIPYGKFYEEIYSIVRFVSAWQPKTGRQSEMRMLYNFLSAFGESVKVKGKWDYLDFFILPTYEEIINEDLDDFPKFKTLYGGMKKIWKIYFTDEQELEDMKIKSLKKAWPQAKDNFMKEITFPLYKKGKLTLEEKQNIDRLVDAFNRHSWRAAFFIWSIMSLHEKDYRTWDKKFFVKFYLNKKRAVGSSPKVIACFLQQGFKNEEVIPIDIWVKSFYELALGIQTEEKFFNSFSKMGKLERAIWLSSQANKTNIKTFFDLMWCTRYGVTGNSELRGPNPISCYECKLMKKCPSYAKIKKSPVLIYEEGEKSLAELIKEAELNECKFICLTKENVPKKIFEKRGKNWKLIDEFSGYLLTDQKIKFNEKIMKVREKINFNEKIMKVREKINFNEKIMKVNELISSLPNFF